MSASVFLGSLIRFSFLGKLFRWAAGGLMSLAFLGWVVDQTGPRGCEVVVHVYEADVEVAVGDRAYRIEGRRDRPIVCDLPPGRHTLVMRRGDQVLFEEEFEVRHGENVVRVAWAPGRGAGPGPSR
jgi:hypothetical protein